MHIPDGFINGSVSASAGLVAAGGFGVALARTRTILSERVVPMAALMAAFVFAAQLINFPVALGVSGHLTGAVLAAVLVGPATAIVVMAIVLGVQALIFADGGLTAYGLNFVNLGLVAVLAGYSIFLIVLRMIGKTLARLPLAASVAAGLSIPIASLAFAAEYAIGGNDAIASGSLALALVATHSLIGIGEAFLTGAIVTTIVRVRPDLIFGATGLR